MKKTRKLAAIYREKLNQLEDQLTPTNKDYFDDLRMYMSFGGLLVDEGELNAQLYQMATDLIAAQADGITAVDFFGNDPKGLADSLLANTTKADIKTKLSLVGSVVGVLWLINLISDFSSSGVMKISLPQYLLSGLLGVLGVAGVFGLLKWGIFKRQKKDNKLVFLGIFLILLLVVGGQLAAGMLLVDDGLIEIFYPADLILLSILLIALTVWLIKAGDPAFYPMTMVLYVFALIGVVRRLNSAQLLTGMFWEKWFSVIALVLAGVAYIIWTWIQGKKLEKS